MRKSATVLFTLVAAACVHSQTPQRSLSYVALGSSFAAGAGIGDTRPGTPERCQRALNNYASLLAAKLSLDLNDQSCGGATTAHVLNNWDELPPQLDAVDAQTDLVTITVGGNDLNYIGNLYMAGCDPEVGFTYKGKHRPCWPFRLPDEADYVAVESQMVAIGKEVRRRAPGAKLVFVQYVTLVPESPCPALQLSEARATEMRKLGLKLAQATRNAAAIVGAAVLDADRRSESHTTCDPAPWSKGAINPEDKSPGAGWHPNDAGHAAIAEALAEFLTVDRIGPQ